jgi:hypothetical protein
MDWQHRPELEADAFARFEPMKNQRWPRPGQHELTLFQQHKLYANPE